MKKAILYTFLVVVLLIWLFPFFWLILTSVKIESEIFAIPPVLVPVHYTLDHYIAMFSRFSFGQPLFVSILVASITVAITLVVTSPAAFFLSQYEVKGANLVLVGILFCRVLSPVALLLPLYNLIDMIGLINTPYAIFLGHLTWSLPLACLLLKSFFDELPKELHEAAVVDGASSSQILLRIILPISTPSLAVTAIFTFMFSWTEYLFAVSFAPSFRTAPVALGNLVQTYRIYWGELAAGGIVYSLPVLLITFFLQKYIVRGLTLGAVRG